MAAKDVASGLPARGLIFAGLTDAAIIALYAHLTEWPRDALVLASAANPNGLIGASGRIGQKRQMAELMDSLAPIGATTFGSLPIMPWRCPRMGGLLPPSRRLNDP